MNRPEAEKILRNVMESCAECDICRFLMEGSCHFFPELYRLYDRENEAGTLVTGDELRRMAGRCTLCGLCPCPNVRADVIRGKTEQARREGMPLAIRLLADVQGFGRLCGAFPRLANAGMSFEPVKQAAKKIARIHPKRELPRVPSQNFFSWAEKRGLRREPGRSPKAAYFAGCTAGYLFPQVARAAVTVLERNGISVFVPPQECCGMPTLLEGDSAKTLRRVRSNLAVLLQASAAGYDLVCTCPTCGYLMKLLLREGAYYSEPYQRSVGAGSDEIRIPKTNSEGLGYMSLKRAMYGKILKDEGYFAGIDPLRRIDLADSVKDMGEYLGKLFDMGRFNARFGKVSGRMVYFASCHQREQQIGSPYEKLLALIPGLTGERVGGEMDCCGMGGSLGFKESFYNESVALGRPLMHKIEAAAPEGIITECLSCRLQFKHLLPFPVFHPLEALSRAYETAGPE